MLAPVVARAQSRVTVDGAVDAQRTLDIGALQALPPLTTAVSYAGAHGTTSASFTGPSLWSVLGAAGLSPVPGAKNALRNVIVATAADGYVCAFSGGELNPLFGGARPDLLAYARDGQPMDNGLRTVAPGDAGGARYVSMLTGLHVIVIPAGAPGGDPARFSIGGLVEHPGAYAAPDLQAMSPVTETVTYGMGTHAQTATFTGVPLWSLLTAAGITDTPGIKNATLRDYVLATASDGYAVAFSVGELDPRFGGGGAQPDMVAYAKDGQPLEGGLRLVVPGDGAGGRYVSKIVSLTVVDATAAAASAKDPAPEHPAQ